MRIIAGTLKGRRLSSPRGGDVRPTADSLRETLFNVLDIEGARVVDAFAGTGAIGLEALSRGARHITFVEKDPRVIRVLNENIHACGAADACVIIRDDFLRSRVTGEADVVIADPPYDIQSLDAVAARAAMWVTAQGRFVLEHSRRREAPIFSGTLRRTRVLTAGDSTLSFYDRVNGPDGN